MIYLASSWRNEYQPAVLGNGKMTVSSSWSTEPKMADYITDDLEQLCSWLRVGLA